MDAFLALTRNDPNKALKLAQKYCNNEDLPPQARNAECGNCEPLFQPVLPLDSLEGGRLGRRQQAPKLFGAYQQGRLCLPSAVGQGLGPPGPTANDRVAEKQAGTDKHRRPISEKAQVEQRKLQSVLGERTVHAVAAVCLVHVVDEVGGRGDSDLEVQGIEYNRLQVEDLPLGIRVVSDVRELVRFGWVNLLELGRDVQGDHAQQLELLPRNWLDRQVAVDDVHGEEERFPPQVVLHVHLHQPIDQDGAHLVIDIGLAVHVVRLRAHLLLEEPREDIRRVLASRTPVGS